MAALHAECMQPMQRMMPCKATTPRKNQRRFEHPPCRNEVDLGQLDGWSDAPHALLESETRVGDAGIRDSDLKVPYTKKRIVTAKYGSTVCFSLCS